ncbi:MAG: hypothetical protein DME60_14585 [Verrucomicrobia bacterium]|nr:MAG: hypothetical protein DME60_14585 [Verrucomicrobiota bacterium]
MEVRNQKKTKKSQLHRIMKTKNSIVCCLIALLALPVLGAFAETPAGFGVQLITTFDYPGSGNSTLPQRISDSGDIVGSYIDSSLVERGFIRFRNGNFSAPIVDPNDTGGRTEGFGINNSRLVCGDYLNETGLLHGYFLMGGRFHNFDVPGSILTFITGVNNAGDFCGSDLLPSDRQLAFFSLGGIITEFTVPHAANSIAEQINSSNQVCGFFVDGSSVLHGYYRDSDGAIYAPIDPAGSTGTIIFGNNDSNWMVGRYSDSGGLTHGLLFIPPNTSLNGINVQGQISGRYVDTSGIAHGIIARVVRSAADQSTPGVTPQRQSSQAGPLPSMSEGGRADVLIAY